MSFYYTLLLCFSIFILVSGISIYIKYKASSGFFFLIFSLFFPLWYGLYIFAGHDIISPEKVLQIYRFQYSLSLVGFYSVLFFILFYGLSKKSIQKYSPVIYSFFGSVFILSNFTPYIVKDIRYSEKLSSYVEIFGPLYGVFVFLYAIIFPLFVYIAYIKIKTLRELDRIRIIYILIGFLLFLVVSLIFLVFLPFILGDSSLLYGEKLSPFFILPFILSVLYVSHRYNFTDYKIYLHNIFIYICSGVLMYISILGIKFLLGDMGENMWQRFSGWDVLFGIGIFLLFLRVLGHKYTTTAFQKSIIDIQENITSITEISTLNMFLSQEFQNKLGINQACIDANPQKYSELLGFFQFHRYKNMFFFHDLVFFHKNKHKLNHKKVLEQLEHPYQIIFPLAPRKRDVEFFLCIGKKKNLAGYTSEELQILGEFSKFLEYHLKYISLYNKLQSISLELDKRVDEKTIEYNTLFTKQREFIRYLGHEIKNPLTNTIFLAEDIQKATHSEDAEILYRELLKISDLVTHVFQAEKFDLEKIHFLKKKMDISVFLREILMTFETSYTHINFDIRIDSQLGEHEIDDIQSRQVIQNLVGNAIKFADKNTPKILFIARYEEGFYRIEVHDNGAGFQNNEQEEIFKKYTTGKSGSVGIGLGLYLCKQIVELHGGTITAQNSNILGGASFILRFS